MLRLGLGLLLSITACCQTIDIGSAADPCVGGIRYEIPVADRPAGLADPTGRYGKFICGLAASNTPQILTLSFIEWTAKAPGLRKFSVQVNNQPVIQDIDLFVEAGYMVPFTRSFVVVGSEGRVEVSFTYSLRSALVTAISLAPLVVQSPPVDDSNNEVSYTPGMWAVKQLCEVEHNRTATTNQTFAAYMPGSPEVTRITHPVPEQPWHFSEAFSGNKFVGVVCVSH